MITSLVYLVVYICVVALIIYLLNYLIDAVLQEPFHRVAKIALMVISVLIVIVLLLNFVGVIDGGPPRLVRP
jgi:preprotein translocase subunit SecE